MKTFKLKISTPDGSMFDGDALKLDVRGIEGELAVMAGHVPFVTTVKPGECRIILEDDTVRTGRVNGGLLSVSKEAVTLLSSSFRWEE